MIYDLTYAQAKEKAEHLKALGQTVVYLNKKSDDLPWDRVTHVEGSSVYRLNGPTGFRVIADDETIGLTLKWSIDMEQEDANGKSINLFDRNRLREIARKLPKAARKSLSEFLSKQVLPEVQKRTVEWRKYLNQQADSEDCLLGLIAYADSI